MFSFNHLRGSLGKGPKLEPEIAALTKLIADSLEGCCRGQVVHEPGSKSALKQISLESPFALSLAELSMFLFSWVIPSMATV